MAWDSIKNFAKMQGGACVYEFSQGAAFQVAQATQRFDSKHKDGTWNDQGKMYKMVLRGKGNNQAEMGGICATLCAFWMAFHASQGKSNYFTRSRSVWDYLFNEGGINLGAAQNIVVEHHQSTGDQIAFFTKFLEQFHVKKRTKRMSGSAISHVFMPFNSKTAFSVGKEITENFGYKLIQLKKSLDGSGSGHMVCAFCDGQDVLFMDPNMGEFWLPSVKAFKAWLAFFWANSYGTGKAPYKAMRVHDYIVA